MNDTVAVIVTYNRKTLLKECIEAVRSQTVACDILVIDNASTDGTGALIEELQREEHPSSRLRYHNTGANLGGAGGFCVGMKQAYELGYRYIWLMDDDCIVTPTALEELLKVGSQHDSFGFLASRIIYDDGALCEINMPRAGMFRKRYYPDLKSYRCDLACFTSVLFPRSVVAELGLPIRDFFIWSDDWEYTRRISRRHVCYACMDSVAVHRTPSRQSTSIVTDNGERIDRYRYIYRNDVYIYRREGLPGILYLILRDLAHMARCLLFSRHDRLKKCGIILLSTLQGFGFKPRVERV